MAVSGRILRMRCCSRTNGVGSDIIDLGHILIIMARAYGATNSSMIVVECDTVNGYLLAIDFQAVWCIFNFAESSCNRNDILLTRTNADANGVETWVVAAP